MANSSKILKEDRLQLLYECFEDDRPTREAIRLPGFPDDMGVRRGLYRSHRARINRGRGKPRSRIRRGGVRG